MTSWKRPTAVAPIVCVLSLAFLTPAFMPPATAAESRSTLRAGAAWLGTSSSRWEGDLLIMENLSVNELEASRSLGPQIGFEYRFTHRFGGDVALLRAEHDFRGDGLNFPKSTFGRAVEWPLLFGANFHWGRHPDLDLYAGPILGWVHWEDMKPGSVSQYVDVGRIRMHDVLAYGVGAGMDAYFSPHWGINLAIRGLRYDARTDDAAVKAVLHGDLKIPIDPIVGTAGLVFRW